MSYERFNNFVLLKLIKNNLWCKFQFSSLYYCEIILLGNIYEYLKLNRYFLVVNWIVLGICLNYEVLSFIVFDI